MERKNKIFFIIITITFLLTVIILRYPILDKKVIPASFFLSKNPGFGHIEGELLFGAITANQSGSRKLFISNTFKEEIEISIESSGEISSQIIVSENNFRLTPWESKDITFTVYTAGLTEYKEYSGKIIILSKRV